eukprot:CAMPEP_0194201360 /NCGR_PEP_ID=MMETSP0156-20130528/1649_1 /TAXON_ID=33649 /ORGANISM="Thalassionema nitzschioides, Strain L26-B" /LENGTH=192 /DNA_ID=CAMNT_0038926531 /DNA_START=27 /DNA_END=603 /DNA_ORIENTATION=-
MKNICFVLVCLLAAYCQANNQCPAGRDVPCNDPEYHTCPNLPNYRRFCDGDGTVLGDGIQRTICAPCVVMKQLFTEGDTCGDCATKTESPTMEPTPMVTIPETTPPTTAAPVVVSAAPFTLPPVTDSPHDLPPVTVPPVTVPPVTGPPVTSEPVAIGLSNTKSRKGMVNIFLMSIRIATDENNAGLLGRSVL